MVLATFALAFFFLTWSAIMLFIKRKSVDSHIIITLYPMLATMILVEAVQLYLPELQFTGPHSYNGRSVFYHGKSAGNDEGKSHA